MRGYQSGAKGMWVAMPTFSWEIEGLPPCFIPLPGASVSFPGVMKNFEEYFSFEAILGDLIRWRIKGQDVGGTLPPRCEWCRDKAPRRKSLPSEEIHRRAIWRKVNGVRQQGRLLNYKWGLALQHFVDEVRNAVFSGEVAFQAPRVFNVTKGYENGIEQFRSVAQFDQLSDRVIVNRIRVYVRDVLEDVLGEHCYSYRRNLEINHQTAIKALQEWRVKHSAKAMFVAECDIKKFFDTIAHNVVQRRWNEIGFDPLAEKIFEAYLAAYSCSESERRGLPQGGSLSTVLANLVLAAADKAVQGTDDGHLFYARFCDDVVFIHPDETMCRRAMEAYMAALDGLDLYIHPVEPFIYKPADGSTTNYYSLKSKGPFRWCEAKTGEENCAPWVSFLGSQIRYNGETRIRKESIEKHIRSLGEATASAIREIERGKLSFANTQEADCWFARFRNRLIAKGVGYVTAKVEDCGFCWAGAFPNITNCIETRQQMRHLDNVREGMLCKVWTTLASLKQNLFSQNATFKIRHRYKGRPFSYIGFLDKASRPTNMAFWRRRVLKYSDL